MQNNTIHPTFQFRSGIPALYRDMMRQGIVREAFNFTINGVTLKSIFLIDRKPFELIVGVVGTQFGFIIKLYKGFTAEWLNDADLWELRKLLNLKRSGNQFTSFKLFREIDAHAPAKCSRQKISFQDIAHYRRDVPEADKVFFCGWVQHLTDGRTVRNVEKTRVMMGDQIADFCEKNNISSMWSDKKRDDKPFQPPPSFSASS